MLWDWLRTEVSRSGEGGANAVDVERVVDGY